MSRIEHELTTSVSTTRPPSEPRNVRFVGTRIAGCGGSTCRHVPLASMVVSYVCPWRIVVIFTPGAPNPQTTADCGARWSTIPEPRVFETLNGGGGPTTAMTAAASWLYPSLFGWQASTPPHPIQS